MTCKCGHDLLLTRKEAAAYIGGFSPDTLAVWASTKQYNIPFIKIGHRVRYRRSSLDAFLDERQKT